MMAEKKERNGRVSVSTWLVAKDVEEFDSVIREMEAELQGVYPGAKLTRHSVLQKIISEWLDARKAKK